MMSYLHSARQSFKSCTQAATPPPPLEAAVLLGGYNCIGSKSGSCVLPAMPGGQAQTSVWCDSSASPLSSVLVTRMCVCDNVQACVQFSLLTPDKPGATAKHWLFKSQSDHTTNSNHHKTYDRSLYVIAHLLYNIFFLHSVASYPVRKRAIGSTILSNSYSPSMTGIRIFTSQKYQVTNRKFLTKLSSA